MLVPGLGAAVLCGYSAFGLLLGVLLVGAPRASYAEGGGTDWTGPDPPPVFGKEFASEARARALAGTIRIKISCPTDRTSWVAYRERRAEVFVEKPITATHNPDVVNTIMNQALRAAWAECVLKVPQYTFNVAAMDVYAPRQPGGPSKLIIHAIDYIGLGNSWYTVEDVAGQQDQAEAYARAKADEEAAQVAQVAASRARYLAEQQRRQAESQHQAGILWGWLRLVGFVGLAVWLASKRVMIARWYYRLTPHPAAQMVESAIATGQELDGDLFAQLVASRPANDIEAGVRTEQAQMLSERWRTHEARLQAQEARLLASELAAAHREKARLQAEHELLAAAAAHERAAARVAALREQRNPNGV